MRAGTVTVSQGVHQGTKSKRTHRYHRKRASSAVFVSLIPSRFHWQPTSLLNLVQPIFRNGALASCQTSLIREGAEALTRKGKSDQGGLEEDKEGELRARPFLLFVASAGVVLLRAVVFRTFLHRASMETKARKIYHVHDIQLILWCPKLPFLTCERSVLEVCFVGSRPSVIPCLELAGLE